MYSPRPIWEIEHPKYQVKGLKVFNSHPMFVYLNAESMHNFNRLKEMGPLYSLDEATTEPFKNVEKPGAGSLFTGLCSFIRRKQKKSYTLSEIPQLWKESI